MLQMASCPLFGKGRQDCVPGDTLVNACVSSQLLSSESL